MHGRQERLRLSLWLDGIIGALVVSAVGAALVFRAILASGEGDTALIGTDLAYLLGDFALIGLVIAVFALTGWRPGRRTWGCSAPAWSCSPLVDGFFMWEDATGHAICGTAPAALWPAGALLVASAAWVRGGSHGGGGRPRVPRGHPARAMPLVFALTALVCWSCTRSRRSTRLRWRSPSRRSPASSCGWR